MRWRSVLVLASVAIFLPSSAVGRVLPDRQRPAPVQEQFPNLVPLPAGDLEVGHDDDEALRAIRFSVSIWNAGDYSFDVLGRPEAADPFGEAEAEQCVAWATPRTCLQRKSVGSLVYHQEHDHYHFEDFALYELRKFRSNGSVNMSPKGLVSSSEKVSFCLVDIERRDGSDPTYTAPWPLYFGCYTGLGQQGISPGWVDVYPSSLPGQFVPIEGVPDGRYAIVLHTDPGGKVFESNDDDNVSVVGIELAGGGASLGMICAGAPGSLVCDKPVGPES
ncbi:MAG TPA: lysyl oxidase family protein [Actinomycetota bacterium]|nr:lysyl oxidase family protein [Actinomycetota bacterium]